MATASSALATPMQLTGKYTTRIPKLVYGTAWKKERTADLVYQAIKAGFRGVDTAAQPKHYQEALVGDGIRQAISEGIVKREDLYIQTKYTPISGQNPSNMPYDSSLQIPDQIRVSVESSLKNLSTGEDAYLDCLLLHTPLATVTETITAWQTLAPYVHSGKIRNLGISNVPLPVLAALMALDPPIPKPAVVQNRFYAATKYEVQMRQLCREQGIIFQTFWTLTGNPNLLKSSVVSTLAQKAGISKEVALYALVLGLDGITVLDGTKNESRMREDLDEVELVGRWAESSGDKDWADCLGQFKHMILDIT
ncbi:MAG: hypothetical protein M1818_008004 [Claussenomyces sp. TS43310]|nr:MAG: hypothetical protein M1818_008004 [Claussenomyces sp. TS43310]